MKNKTKIEIAGILAMVFVIYTVASCKKDPEPTTDSNAPAVPSVYTDTTTYVSQTWATLNSMIGAGNLMTTISFDWDTSINYRFTLPANPDTLSGHTTTKRIGEVTGLTPGTLYHYRAKAVNSMGTTYGVDKIFTTLPPYVKNIVFNPDLTYGEVSDVEGNIYKTIQIGTQLWMAENLLTKKYNDGTDIPLVNNTDSWTNLTSSAYCWYNNSIIDYGALYNWHAVNSGKLCPTGWHVPSDDEWTVLSTNLGGLTIAGSKLKETGTNHWLSPNLGATNSSGFSALAGGYRYYTGVYNSLKRYGFWWSSTESASTTAYARDLCYSYSNMDKISSEKRSGASVRCVKD